LFGLFILFFTTAPEATFVVMTAVFFAAMAFGLPAALCAQCRSEGQRYTGTVETRTGPLPTTAAAVQITLIPIATVIGLIAFIALAK
jgi:hypothetical protein